MLRNSCDNALIDSDRCKNECGGRCLLFRFRSRCLLYEREALGKVEAEEGGKRKRTIINAGEALDKIEVTGEGDWARTRS